MTKEELKSLLKEGLSTRQIAIKSNTSSSTISRWVRKYELTEYYDWNVRQMSNKKLGTRRYKCRLCDKESEKSLCQGCNTKVRRYRSKIVAINLKGGKCQRCGWVGNIAGFEFHHRADEKKEFEISNVANKAWSVIEKEIEKCDLLCAVCHRIEHSNNENENFRDEVYSYSGTQEIFQKHLSEVNRCQY